MIVSSTLQFSRPSDPDGFALRITLSDLPDYACLDVGFPQTAASMNIGQMLDLVFPADEPAQAALEETFDLSENPDLPEIYQCFLEVMGQFRLGLCHLAVSGTDGAVVEMETPISGIFEGIEDGATEEEAVSGVNLLPQYRALDYAASMGWDGGEPEVVKWLQECVALYFIDKHEVTIPVLTRGEAEGSIGSVVAGLQEKGLIRFSEQDNGTEITEEGRAFIGKLLRETEGYIDRYDLFNDVLWEPDNGSMAFDTGHGEDLRVEVFIYQGLDPLRTVFLLRLYDGTLDEFVNEWQERIGEVSFYDYILEPIVNRCVVGEELLDIAMEEGFAKLEEAAEEARESRMFDRIVGRPRYSPY